MSIWYEVNIDKTKWEIKKQYQNLKKINYAKGIYGQICSAHDTNQNQKITIKKISKAFMTIDEARRAYREIKLLKHVRDHENILNLLDFFTRADNLNDFEDIYLVTNLICPDLNHILKTQRLDEQQRVFFSYQLLRGLKYLHSANIILKDLKPSNITINENCILQIIDLGNERIQSKSSSGYVTSKWYRAPELNLKWVSGITKAVDLWSFACILVEMYTCRPLFPGRNHIDHLNLVLNVVGYPDEVFLKEINEEACVYICKMDKKPKKCDLQVKFPEITSKQATQLIETLLKLNPKERLECEQALENRYFSMYHDPSDEPVCAKTFKDSIEQESLSIDELKEKIFQEIHRF